MAHIEPEVRNALLDRLPLGFLIWRLSDASDDASLCLAGFNDTAAELLDRDLAPHLGESIEQALPAVPPDIVREFANAARTGIALARAELSYGDRRIARARFAASVVPVGERTIAVLFENMTVTLEAEREVRRLNDFLDSIIENLPAMVFVKDAEQLRFQRLNRAAEQILGIPRRSMLGKSDLDFFPERQARAFQHADRQTLAGGRVIDIPEEPISTPSGQRWLHTRKIPISGARGPEYLLGISFDITEAKATEEARRNAEQSFRTLVERCPDAILIQRAGRLLYVNSAFRRCFGFAPEQLVLGAPVTSLPGLGPALARGIATLPAPGSSSGSASGSEDAWIDLELVDLRGSPLILEAAAVECDFEGEPATLVVARDVTLRRASEDALERRVHERTRELAEAIERLERESADRRRAETALNERETQLRQAQKMEAVGRLAGGIAHDFNNLLSVILSYAAVLADCLPDEDPRRGDVDEIQRAGERAAELTRQLLAFSRQQLLEPRIVDLNEVISAAGSMLRRLLGEHLELRFVPAPELGRVRVDRGQIEIVLMNLVANARDAMPHGGVLTLRTADIELTPADTELGLALEPGPYVRLSVRDTGKGIEPTEQSQIFEPFYTTKEVGRGTGLGLSSVYGIVRQSGGDVRVTSAPGAGTTFEIYLPRMDGITTSKAEARSDASPRDGTEAILLVEDEPRVRKIVGAILEKHGYRVTPMPEPAEALAWIQQSAPALDLLVTDVVMPGMSGPELAQSLRPMYPSLRVLYMSGYAGGTIARHGLEIRAAAFLQKPFQPEDLLRKVRAVLDADSESAS